MNIALSSLIFIFLLLPAIVLRSVIIKSDSLENPLDTSIKTELGIIFIFALIQHLFGYSVLVFSNFVGLNPYNIDLSQLYYIIIGQVKYFDNNISLHYSILFFLIYSLIQIVVNLFLAIVLRSFIYSNYLDLKSSLIPVTNEWDNLLSGRNFEMYELNRLLENINDLADLKQEFVLYVKENESIEKKDKKKRYKLINDRFKEEKKIIDDEIEDLKKLFKDRFNYVEVDVLVNTSDGDVIYKGIVEKYFLAKDNKLDKLVLHNVYKRPFLLKQSFAYRTSHLEPDFKNFKSSFFIIKKEEIINLNVRYTLYEEELNQDVDEGVIYDDDTKGNGDEFKIDDGFVDDLIKIVSN